MKIKDTNTFNPVGFYILKKMVKSVIYIVSVIQLSDMVYNVTFPA
jgi:hypothetical protein